MAGDGHPVERAPPGIPCREMSPPARSRQRLAPDPVPGLPSGYWYSPPDPGRDADARGRSARPAFASEGEELAADVDIDDPLVRAGRRYWCRVRARHAGRRRLQRLRARISAEEPVDVERHSGRRLAGQHLLEMSSSRDLSSSLRKNARASSSRTRDQLRAAHQHGVEGGDSLRRAACHRASGSGDVEPLGFPPPRRQPSRKRTLSVHRRDVPRFRIWRRTVSAILELAARGAASALPPSRRWDAEVRLGASVAARQAPRQQASDRNVRRSAFMGSGAAS